MPLASPIPRIGFGTWNRTGEEGYRAVSDALEIGYRHIDTAEMYGNEVEVGRAIAASGLKRNEVFVTTKVAPAHLGPGQVMPHVKASLTRLGMDTVDLLLVHWPSVNGEFDIADYMAQFTTVKATGLASHIGVSNFTRKLLDAAIAVVGQGIIATNQVECHVLLQNRVIAEHAKSKGIPITAYSPLARGRLTDHAGIKAIAARHGATPEQVGLAFLLAEGHIVIPSSSNAARIKINFEAEKLTLSAQDVSDIREMDEGRRLINASWAPEWDP
jgi:2,5-diketo-D-gluconate reductase B